MSSLLLILAAVALAWLGLRRANELCAVRIEGGRAHLLRGRAPERLLFDLGEIARHEPNLDMTIRVVSEGGSPRLEPRPGMSEGTAQRLRNVVGEHRIVHFRTGRRAQARRSTGPGDHLA